ncbi:MAG: prepilin-type N-terminal cleavage/methylation domain-containing protein [Candidatus Gracilibacteria bacterium]|nr:prepilin-type N-terminal cleavage/methylation domain-containing protein [Candidatus Gracilibacteria bacterium]
MKKNLKAFTLIELLVAISIFFALVITTYIPYAFYQNKAKVNITIKDISQSINEARNLAINGLEREVTVDSVDEDGLPIKIKVKKNLSIGILLSKTDKNQIKYYGYPYDMNIDDIKVPEFNGILSGTPEELEENIFIVKSNNILYPINIDEIKTIDTSVNTEEDNENIFILFSAIKGTPSIHKLDTYNHTIAPLSGDEVKVAVSFKNAKPGPLRKELTYTPKTNLIDY